MKSFPPRLDILPAPQAAIWRELAPLRHPGFVLYGGTAIALRLGHRHSVDFDFFTSLPLDRAALKRSLPWLASAAVLQDEPESLTVLSPGGVKVSFFGGLEVGRVGEPEVSEDGVVVAASLEDLLAFKLKLVVQRVEAKDYLDVAAILRSGLSLERGLAAAEVLFAPDLPPMVVLKALTYFEGGDLSSLPADVRETLCAAVAGVDDLPVVPRRSDSLG
ncbi:MAG: nucleotidyl transferase AbiEii/AbiGii toxin family protein [Chthoniobacterales bacterium]